MSPAHAKTNGALSVAMVIQRFRPHIGGAERQIERLAPALEERGARVTVITRRLPGTERREHLPGLDVVRVPVGGGRRGAGALYSAGGAFALSRLRPRVVHVHGVLSEALAGLAGAAATRSPVVVKLMSAGPEGCLDRLAAKPFAAARLRLLRERVAAFVVLSDESERELRAVGVDEDRLARIPNGVDVRRFKPADGDERRRLRGELDLPLDEPLALYCGRLESPKRVDALVEAFASVPRGRLVIVGKGSERERIARLAAGAEGRVLLRAAVDDPAPYYRAADLYLSASAREGMSGSALEAMASGLCVGATEAGGMAELLSDGAGVLLPEPDRPDFAPAIAGLLADDAGRGERGRRARRRVEERYSLEATAERLMDLYRRVIEARGEGAR